VRQTTRDLLAGVATEDLEDELDRRASAGRKTRDFRPKPARVYCDIEGCVFLKYVNEYTQDIDAICRKGHAIRFRMPANDSEGFDGDWGFHRVDRNTCLDYRSANPEGSIP